MESTTKSLVKTLEACLCLHLPTTYKVLWAKMPWETLWQEQSQISARMKAYLSIRRLSVDSRCMKHLSQSSHRLNLMTIYHVPSWNFLPKQETLMLLSSNLKLTTEIMTNAKSLKKPNKRLATGYSRFLKQILLHTNVLLKYFSYKLQSQGKNASKKPKRWTSGRRIILWATVSEREDSSWLDFQALLSQTVCSSNLYTRR